jgi:hypothetical protein
MLSGIQCLYKNCYFLSITTITYVVISNTYLELVCRHPIKLTGQFSSVPSVSCEEDYRGVDIFHDSVSRSTNHFHLLIHYLHGAGYFLKLGYSAGQDIPYMTPILSIVLIQTWPLYIILKKASSVHSTTYYVSTIYFHITLQSTL